MLYFLLGAHLNVSLGLFSYKTWLFILEIVFNKSCNGRISMDLSVAVCKPNIQIWLLLSGSTRVKVLVESHPRYLLLLWSEFMSDGWLALCSLFWGGGGVHTKNSSHSVWIITNLTYVKDVGWNPTPLYSLLNTTLHVLISSSQIIADVRCLMKR